jgi:crotonobetainyl-CoA:carnitine CoA-transferase CaiB-like acyl-CoA transferase
MPLNGIRVVEFTTAWVGPGCGMMMAEMGAEVIKIDNPAIPDLHRRLHPYAEAKPGLNRGGWFALYNRGKKECVLDLKQPQNVEIAKRLVAKSDMVITNFAPRVMDSLGLGYAALKEVKPEIIMVAASGYGATGPDRDCVAYGAVLEAYGGLDSMIGYPDSPPLGCGFPVSDHTAATLNTFALLAALHHRDLTGEGQYIDLSEVEALLVCMPEPILEYTMTGREPQPRGNRDDVMVPHGCYRCKGDDKWVAIAVDTEEEWQNLCTAMGKAELARDERFQDKFKRFQNEDLLDRLINEWTGQHAHVYVMKILQSAGVAAGPVYNSEEIYNDPQLRERGHFVAFDHPEVAERELPGVFAVLSETPMQILGREPLVGEHTEWVLKELLGPGDSEGR